MAQMVKVSAYNVGDAGLIPGMGRSPGEGNGNPKMIRLGLHDSKNSKYLAKTFHTTVEAIRCFSCSIESHWQGIKNFRSLKPWSRRRGDFKERTTGRGEG